MLALADARRCRGSTARGAGACGSHWPNSSRNEKTRSLARARSSSRRAPPIAASKPCSLDRVEQRRRLQPVARRARAGLLDDAALVDRLLHGGDDRAARRARRRGGRGTRSPRGSCGRCRRACSGNGNRAGRNAFSARRSRTIESLPPENSSTGRSSSAATSRMMWIASASSASRWVRRWVVASPAVAISRASRVEAALGLVVPGPAAVTTGAGRVQCVQPIEA